MNSHIAIAMNLLIGHQVFVDRNTGLTNDAKLEHFLQNLDYLVANNRHFIADTMAEYQPNGDATTEGQSLQVIGYALSYVATKHPLFLERAEKAWQAYMNFMYGKQIIPDTPKRFAANWIANGKEPTLANYPIHPSIPTNGGYKSVPLEFTNGMAQIPHGSPFWGEYLDVATFAHRGHMAWGAINATVQNIADEIDWSSVLDYRVTTSDTPWLSETWVDWNNYLTQELGRPENSSYLVLWGSGEVQPIHQVSWINTWAGTKIGIGPGPDDQLWSGDILDSNIPLIDRGKVQLADTSINGVYLFNYAVRLPEELGGYKFQRGEVYHNRPVNTPLNNSPSQYGNASDAELWWIEACYLLWRLTGKDVYKKALDCAFYTAHEYGFVDQTDMFFRQSIVASTPFTDGISYGFSYPSNLDVNYSRDQDGYINIEIGASGQLFLEQQAVWSRVNADPLSGTVAKLIANVAGSGDVGCKFFLDIQPTKVEDPPIWYVATRPRMTDGVLKHYEIPLSSFAKETDDNGDDYLTADVKAVENWGTVTYQSVFDDNILDGRSASVIEATFPDDDGGLIIGFWGRDSGTSEVKSIVYRATHDVNIKLVDDNDWRWWWMLPATNNQWVELDLPVSSLNLGGYQPDHPNDPSPEEPVFTELSQIEIQLDTSDTNVTFAYFCVNDKPPLFTANDGWVMSFRIAFDGPNAYSAKVGNCYIKDGRVDNLKYVPGIAPFSNIYSEGTYQIGNWRGMPYTGYQWPTMYCIQDNDRYQQWLNNQIDMLWDAQQAYYHQTNVLGPVCAAYVWNRTDNRRYGGKVPTPYFTSTFNVSLNASLPDVEYKCDSSVRLFLKDAGGALWEYAVPAASDWTALSLTNPVLYSGTPSGDIIWSVEPLLIINEKPFSLRAGDEVTYPQSVYDYFTTYHWGDGKPWAGYQPRAFNAGARAVYELTVRSKPVPVKLIEYVNNWADYLIDFMMNPNGLSPSDFPTAPDVATPIENDFTGHMCGLWLSGLSYILMSNVHPNIHGLVSTVDKLLAELNTNYKITDVPNHVMNGSWSPALRLDTGSGIENNGMFFGFYTGEILRGLSLYIMYKTHGAGYDMYKNMSIPSHDDAVIDWDFVPMEHIAEPGFTLDIDLVNETVSLVKNGELVTADISSFYNWSTRQLKLTHHWFMQSAGTFLVTHDSPLDTPLLELDGDVLLRSKGTGNSTDMFGFDFYSSKISRNDVQEPDTLPKVNFYASSEPYLTIGMAVRSLIFISAKLN